MYSLLHVEMHRFFASLRMTSDQIHLAALAATIEEKISMKKLLLICLALCLVFGYVAIASAGSDKGKSETVNGWVTDAKCGVKGAHAGAEECAKKCLAAGAKMVVVTDTDQKVLTVDNPDALKGHEGHHVAVTGTVSGESIHVDSAKML
jgi:hypothetical protein